MINESASMSSEGPWQDCMNQYSFYSKHAPRYTLEYSEIPFHLSHKAQQTGIDYEQFTNIMCEIFGDQYEGCSMDDGSFSNCGGRPRLDEWFEKLDSLDGTDDKIISISILDDIDHTPVTLQMSGITLEEYIDNQIIEVDQFFNYLENKGIYTQEQIDSDERRCHSLISEKFDQFVWGENVSDEEKMDVILGVTLPFLQYAESQAPSISVELGFASGRNYKQEAFDALIALGWKPSDIRMFGVSSATATTISRAMPDLEHVLLHCEDARNARIDADTLELLLQVLEMFKDGRFSWWRKNIVLG